eukprot:4011509-Pleurochrysis_carterae.AAC.1
MLASRDFLKCGSAGEIAEWAGPSLHPVLAALFCPWPLPCGRFLRPSADARAHTRRRVLTDTDRDFTCKTAVFSLHVIVNEKTYSCRFVLLRRSRGRTGVAVERAMRLSKRAPLCGVKLTRRSRIPRLSKLGLRVRACGRVLVVQSCSSCAFTG